MNYIRLKSNLKPENVQDRLRYHPSILELHLTERDVGEPLLISKTIRMLKCEGVKVYLHHPTTYQKQYMDILSENPVIRHFYDRSTALLIDLCQREQVQLVIHAHYKGTESSECDNPAKVLAMKERIQALTEKGEGCLLWENTTEGIFSLQNEQLLQDIVEPLQLPLCFDISHGFIAVKGNNQALYKALQQYQSYIRYYHVVDSTGVRHDGLPLGKGKIDWRMVKPFVIDEDFIFEIDLKSSQHTDCAPMVESALYLSRV